MKFFRIAIWLVLTFVTGVTWGAGGEDSTRVKPPLKDSVFAISPEQAAYPFLFEPADILSEGILMGSAIDSTQFYINKGRAVLAKIREANNFIKNIDQASEFELPVGLENEAGGIKYTFGIEAIRLTPTHAEMDIFMEFIIPNNDMPLMFMVKGIKYTKKGGIVGDASLVLLGDYGINLNGDKIQVLLKGGDTYATMDCDGFKQLGVSADVIFSRDLIVPEREDGSVGDGRVSTHFDATVEGWNDLIVQLNLPTFQLKNVPGLSFKVSDAVFDFSDVRNVPSVVFPEGYQSPQFLPDNSNLWRGFFLRDLTIKLPQQFKQRGSTSRTTFNASNVIIDNLGVTGKFEVKDLITLQQGDLSGWAFSLTDLHIEIQANQLVEAGFSGDIIIPIAKDDTPFEYSAIINDGGNYLFHVSPVEDLEFEVFKTSKVEIYEASSLEINVVDGQFRPKANLHGQMSIKGSLSEGGQGMELANITFENLQVQTQKPYLSIGNFSFGSEAAQQKMAGFPISIQDIGFKNISDTKVGLDFTLKLNLVGEDSGGFAADAGLTIVGKVDSKKGWQSWKYDDVLVNEIGVDIDGGAFKMNGRLTFYRNDAMYGDGFNGSLKAEFKPGIKVTATAIFGNTKGMRYWYADAMATMPTGTPIFTGVGIYGFGGGAYYRMKIDNNGSGSELGTTPSGITYVPDENAGLGLKAVVSIGSHPRPEAFNGDVTFEISFFKGGGVRYIAFGGNGYLVTPGLDVNLGKLKETTGKMAKAAADLQAKAGKIGDLTHGLVSPDGEGDDSMMDDIFGEVGTKAGEKGSISAHVNISYDFENKVLHGNFEMYINVAGGIIKGVGDGGRAGWAELHFAPDDWYIYVGTPEDRIGIGVGIGPIRAQATAYFMVGTKILGSPPPPPEVSRILGRNDLDYMKDLNALGTGAGFGFGAAFSVSTGDLSFLMFYARFDAGAGFDIMLKDYGDTRCVGSSKRIGINGWYANGQAYAYFEGSVGIRVKVFGVKKKIEILSIGAAAVLQAKLPNPFWMRGIVGGYFSVLGGLVKGNCKFEVTLGKECQFQSAPGAILEDIHVIAELTPGNGDTEINVFNSPQGLFNIPVNKEFELVDEVNGNIKRKFRVNLDHFDVTHLDRKLVGDVEWNSENDVLVFLPYEILPPKESIKISAQVSFEEYSKGKWAPVISDGKKVTEVMENTFKTGEAPDYIPLDNVEFSYPIIGQVNFLKEESPSGYIKLKQAQPYLFELGKEWRQEGRFISSSNQVASFDFHYTYSTNMIEYDIPSELISNQLYSIKLVNVPASKSGPVDRNVKDVTNAVALDGVNIDTEITTKKAEGNIDELEEKDIYDAPLRTSRFSTFPEKMKSFGYQPGYLWGVSMGVFELRTTVIGEEQFDKFESRNVGFNEENLIQFEADLTDNRWYNELLYPSTYQGYPILDKALISRKVDPLGLPPTKAVFLSLMTDGPELTRENASNIQSLLPARSMVVYNLAPIAYKDFEEIQRKCALLSLTNNTADVHRVLYSTFPTVIKGNYNIKMSYFLPGLKKLSSQTNLSISLK